MLQSVFQRELHRMASRRIYWVACLVLPLFSLLFMATIFGDGQICRWEWWMPITHRLPATSCGW